MVMRQMVALPLTEVINWIKVLWNTIAQMIMLRRSSKVPSIKKNLFVSFLLLFFLRTKNFHKKFCLINFLFFFLIFLWKKIFGSFWFSPKKQIFRPFFCNCIHKTQKHSLPTETTYVGIQTQQPWSQKCFCFCKIENSDMT